MQHQNLQFPWTRYRLTRTIRLRHRARAPKSPYTCTILPPVQNQTKTKAGIYIKTTVTNLDGEVSVTHPGRGEAGRFIGRCRVG